MKEIILIALGIISILYGILVLQVGSGTGFWMIWEAIGVFFLFWAFLLHTDFFASHKRIKVVFHAMLGVAIAVVITLCGMIMGDFSAKGNQNLDYIIVLGAQDFHSNNQLLHPNDISKQRLVHLLEPEHLKQ